MIKTIGVAIACASLGFVQPKEAEDAVQRLHRHSSLWLSERVIQRALDALHQLSEQ